MKLPAKLSMNEIAHGTGDKGMAFYMYEDTQDLGVVMEARRECRKHGFVETFEFKWLPDQTFPSYAALCAAVDALTDEQIAAEKARWPQLAEGVRERAAITGGCWLHIDRVGRYFASAHTCWIGACAAHAMLCEECAAEVVITGPSVVLRANEARRAHVAARRKDAA